MTIQIPQFTDNIDHIGSTSPTATYDLTSDGGFIALTSKADFDAADAPAYYLSDDKTLYLKADVPTYGNTAIFIANSESDPTSISSVAADASGIILEYSATTGVFSYSMPSGLSDATITVYDVAGMATDLIGGLTADGTVRQTAPTRALSGGLYLATLHARNADGSALTRTVKIGVR